MAKAVKKIAFINGKGGCGKSTSIFHIAGVLSRLKEKVLVIDLDKQRNTTKHLLMNNDNKPEKTVFDFFNGNAEPGEAVAEALFQTRGNAIPKYYGVDCMVSDIRLMDEANLSLVNKEKIREDLGKFINEQGYTWVLVDMPPSNATLNSICFQCIVDYTIIPFSSDMDSVDGYADIMHEMDEARKTNPTLNVLGVYLARYMGNCAVDKYIREELLNFSTFIDIQIPLTSDVRESIMFGRPISYYKMFSNSKKAYEDLVSEMVRRMNS